jgi:hypothetical protein
MRHDLQHADTVEHIVRCLGELLPLRSEAAALKAVETAIEILAKEASRPFPEVRAIKKLAKGSPDDFETLCKVLEPFGNKFQIPLKGCDRPTMTLGEFRSGRMPFVEQRSALHWLAELRGPLPHFGRTKYLAALLAEGLVNEFSEMPPTGTEGEPVRNIAGLFYRAVAGGKWIDLKWHVDAVRRSWRGLNGCRGRPLSRLGHA